MAAVDFQAAVPREVGDMSIQLMTLVLEDWGGSGTSVFEWIGVVGAGLFLLFMILRLLSGLTSGDRYKALVNLDSAAQGALSVEIAKAEDRTSGEIAVVVLERSDRHPAAHWISGALFLLVGSAMLTQWMPWEHPAWFFACQLGLGLGGALLALAVPGFRRGFVTEERASEMAEEQSIQEFYALGLQDTDDRTGVLLFVSLFERRVIILGDDGIDAKIDAKHWEGVRNAVLDGVKQGQLQQGLQKAVQDLGRVLHEHFPVTGNNPNELPDHVIVRRE